MRHSKDEDRRDVAMHTASRRKELMRILRARDAFAVFGFQERSLRRTPHKEYQQKILRKHRELSLMIHPDKCPHELRSIARAFQSLEEASKCLLTSFNRSCAAGTKNC